MILSGFTKNFKLTEINHQNLVRTLGLIIGQKCLVVAERKSTGNLPGAKNTMSLITYIVSQP